MFQQTRSNQVNVAFKNRLRARVSMLSGAGEDEEVARREESARWFARAVAGFPQDAEALTAAGEGILEYGRCDLNNDRGETAESVSKVCRI